MSTATYDVLLYPSAESDLYDIKQYFEQVLKVSPTHLFQKFYDSIEYLEKNPFMYPLVKDPFLSQLVSRVTIFPQHEPIRVMIIGPKIMT